MKVDFFIWRVYEIDQITLCQLNKKHFNTLRHLNDFYIIKTTTTVSELINLLFLGSYNMQGNDYE